MKSRLHVYVHTHEHARAHTHTRTLTHNTQHTYCPQLGDEDRRERDRIRKLKAKVCRCVCLAARAWLLGAAAGRHTRRPPFLSRASRMFTCECCGSDPHAHMCVHTSCVRSSGEETTQRAAGLTGARLVSPLSPSRNLNSGRSCRRPWRRDAEFQTGHFGTEAEAQGLRKSERGTSCLCRLAWFDKCIRVCATPQKRH